MTAPMPRPVEVCDCSAIHLGPCPATPPGLAKHIHVERRGTRMRVFIDDEPLATFTSGDGYSVRITKDQMPGVTVTLVAERVTVDDNWVHSSIGEPS